MTDFELGKRCFVNIIKDSKPFSIQCTVEATSDDMVILASRDEESFCINEDILKTEIVSLFPLYPVKTPRMKRSIQ